MYCTSFIPVYCQPRDRHHVCESGFSLHPFDCDSNNDERRGNAISFPSFNMDRHLDFDKEILRQIIQKHEATFRHQLQELHRLYTRQRQLMDEIRVKECLQLKSPELNHYLVQTQSQISRTPSYPAEWILRSRSDTVLTAKVAQGLIYVAENFQESTIGHPGPLLRKTHYNGVKTLSSRKVCEVRTRDHQLAADVNHDSEEDSEIYPVKMRDLSSFKLKRAETDFFIDLNEPVQLEPVGSSSTSSFEPYECEHSVGINSSMDIDLNSVPLSCLPEAVITRENLLNADDESKAEHSKECLLWLSARRDYNRRVPVSSKDEMPCTSGVDKDYPVLDTEINNKLLETKIQVDLNTSVITEETIPLLSSANIEIKSDKDIDLEAPVSPENNEGSPSRGKSEDIVLEPTPFSAKRKGEPEIEPDTVNAAETLVLISSCGGREFNSSNCLYWFAEIVSSVDNGNDLENEVMKLRHRGTGKDQGKLQLDEIDDFKIKIFKSSQEKAIDRPHAKKEIEISTLSSTSVRDRETKDLHPQESFHAKSSLKRNVGRNSCAKTKRSKLSTFDIKKPVPSITKETGTGSKQSILQGWGTIKKRREGHRGRATKYLVIS